MHDACADERLREEALGVRGVLEDGGEASATCTHGAYRRRSWKPRATRLSAQRLEEAA